MRIGELSIAQIDLAWTLWPGLKHASAGGFNWSWIEISAWFNSWL